MTIKSVIATKSLHANGFGKEHRAITTPLNEKIKSLQNRIKQLETARAIEINNNKMLIKKLRDIININNMSLRNYVKQNTNYDVLSPSSMDLNIAQKIAKKFLNVNDYKKLETKRINEVGNSIENFATSTNNIKIETPISNITNKKKAVGYPDKFVEYKSFDGSEKHKFYLEIKLYGRQTLNSTHRTFYLSTCDKINHSCPHLLIGIEHHNKYPTGNYHIVDMRDKMLIRKKEWNTNNKILYNK